MHKNKFYLNLLQTHLYADNKISLIDPQNTKLQKSK
jgi:hypothetical protein